MSDNDRQPGNGNDNGGGGGPNPWMKSLLIWVGVLVTLALFVTVIDGRTASEYEPEGKAAEEVAALFAWARREVGLPTGRQSGKKTRGQA